MLLRNCFWNFTASKTSWEMIKEIIDGKGKGRDVVADIYLSGNIKADFTEYIDKAVRRYNVMKLIGGDEVPLEDFFVSNGSRRDRRVKV